MICVKGPLNFPLVQHIFNKDILPIYRYNNKKSTIDIVQNHALSTWNKVNLKYMKYMKDGQWWWNTKDNEDRDNRQYRQRVKILSTKGYQQNRLIKR